MTTQLITPYTVGDTAPALTGTVSANLTSTTIEVHIRRPDGTTISRAGTITAVGPPGGWSLTLQSGDLSVAGLYTVEVQVTFSGGAIQTFAYDDAGSSNTFTVRDQLG